MERYELGNGVDENSSRFIELFGVDFYIQCKNYFYVERLRERLK